MSVHFNSSPHRPQAIDAWLDAGVWFGVSGLILTLMPIGWLSGDAVRVLTDNALQLNPNHLLLEPIGAVWLRLWGPSQDVASAIDHLKLLSVWSGALSAGLFRLLVAPGVAFGRLEANHATAWLVLGSGFSRLWTSGEFHMVQMPLLVLTAAAVLNLASRPGFSRGVAVGFAIGAATLLFVSNILLAGTVTFFVALWLTKQRRIRAAANVAVGVLATAFVVAGTAFYRAWRHTADHDFWVWLTTHAGSSDAARSLYDDTSLSAFRLIAASSRAVYGAASSVVDLAPIVELFRDELAVGSSHVLTFVAFVAAAVLLSIAFVQLLRRRDQECAPVIILVLSFVAYVLVFGIYFGNSDDQFYFQLSIPIAALIATVPLRRNRYWLPLIACSSIALGWNAWVLAELVRYPRDARIRQLTKAVSGAELVVFPGNDEAGRLLHLMDKDGYGRRLSLMSLSSDYEPEDGLRVLQRLVDGSVTANECVVFIDIFDVPSKSHPWKALNELGYARDRVLGAIKTQPVEGASRIIGPFTVRAAGADCVDTARR